MASDAEGNGLRRSVYLGALSACILLAVSACSGSASVATSGQPKSATQTTSVTDPQHATGVSSHLVMPSDTLVSGANEQGVLVIENNSGRPVVAAQSCFEHDRGAAHQRPACRVVSTPLCRSDATLPVGVTRLPFTLHASQTVCLIPNGATANASFCQPLPAGTYKTQLFPGLNIPDPSAITVHVVASRTAATRGVQPARSDQRWRRAL